MFVVQKPAKYRDVPSKKAGTVKVTLCTDERQRLQGKFVSNTSRKFFQQQQQQQVWSLSSFKVSHQLLMNDLNHVWSVSLLMTASTALANEGDFEPTRSPLLTRAVSLSFAETTEEPGCCQVKGLQFDKI